MLPKPYLISLHCNTADLILFFLWQFFIQDTKSSNGTYVNNAQVGRGTDDTESVEIRSGDVLQFGVDVTENSKKGKVFVRFQLETRNVNRRKKFWLEKL